MRAKELALFIQARERYRKAKEGGYTVKPRYADPIIAKYRFCNVVRLDDRVTQHIMDWSEKWNGNPDQWFCFVVARLFNLPDTLDAISNYVVPFGPAGVRLILEKRKALGLNTFNAAYIVSTNGLAMDKVSYLIQHVLTPLWKARVRLRPVEGETLAVWHTKLQEFQGMGSFIAAQVVADMKYKPPFFDVVGIPTGFAPDWWTFAASGPGSRRGLNRVIGNPLGQSWREPVWRDTLTALHNALRPLLPPDIGTRMSAQDVQNCLCEFDKYERARLGEGTPKQIYTPHGEK